jgi:prophage antirepressor-like protein
MAGEVFNIIKAFMNDPNIKVLGTPEKPLFRASDIEEILGTLRHVDPEEKVIIPMKIFGESYDMKFLTEEGLYSALLQSQSPIASKFQSEMARVLVEKKSKGEELKFF